MKKLLKRFVAFLDRKFPDRVEVSLADYNSLFETLGAYNQFLQALDKRLTKLEVPSEDLTSLKAEVQKCKDEISKLHVVMGFSGGRGVSLER